MAQCNECLYCDLTDTWRGKAHCEYINGYVYPTEKACSHIRYKNNIGGCYITTIVHEILNNPDNCKVLDVLREFRNNILQTDVSYKKLLMEYDVVGHEIAESIMLDHDINFCKAIYEKTLKPISQMVIDGKYNEAISNYVIATNNLKECYGICNEEISINNYDQSKGGHGKIFVKNN